MEEKRTVQGQLSRTNQEKKKKHRSVSVALAVGGGGLCDDWGTS